MKKKVTITAIILLALIAIIFFAKYAGKNNSGKSVGVKTTVVSKGEIKAYLTTTGVIKSKNTKDYFGPQLKVSKVNVKVGDTVKKGDVLVSYEVEDLKNSIKQAEIQYNNAVLQQKDLLNQKNSIEDKKKSLDKQISELEQLNTPESIKALQDLKNARNSIQDISEEKLKQMDNSVDLAKMSLDAAKSKLNSANANLTADFDGVVTAVNVTEGAIGNMAQPAVTLQDLNNLKAVISLGKFDASKIALDQEAVIKANGETIKGKVNYIDPVAKKAVGPTGSDVTLTADIDLLETPKTIKVEFDADVDVLLASKENVIKVPAETIITDKNGRNYIYVVEGDKAKEKEVKLGIQSDIEAEVLEGLNEGDKIIINPSASIKDGATVKEITEGGK